MKALLLHDLVPDGAAAAALEGAGHDVVRCAGSPARPFPCVGMSGTCPLDGTVDVAVAVHDRPSTSFDPGEVGVVCALRDGIPLVVAGNGAFAPYRGVASAVAAGISDLPGACERAVRAREAELERSTGGSVRLRGGHVRVELPCGSTSRDAVAAHQTVAGLLPAARTIGVGIAGTTNDTNRSEP